MSVPPSDGPAPGGRRRIVMSPGRVLTPIALIAREGEERDALDAQITASRPVVAFPSLAHFITDSTRKERWAGVLLARTHAWDSRLDDYVARRAFIALYALEDEGYGWPEAVRRLPDADALKAWLELLASPELPADDKPRPVRTPLRPRQQPRKEQRAPRISVALAPVRGTVANGSATPDTPQLALPMGSSDTTTVETNTANGITIRTTRRSSAPVSAPALEAAPASVGSTASAPKRRGRPPKARDAGAQLSFEPSENELPARRGRPARASASSQRSPADNEAAIAAVAYQLGFARATELLELVRQRAHELAR